MRSLGFYFDFISPYSWLALMQAAPFAERHGIRWEPHPVVYAKLLESHGLVGPVETEAKRRYTIEDVVRCAGELGLALEGPPLHPFRSLEALRVAVLFRSEPCLLDLCIRMADACWGRGLDLTDPEVLSESVRAVGLDDSGLSNRITDRRIKRELVESTEAARQLGVFGVPTFSLEGELFWGHDRMHQLGLRLGDRLERNDALVERMQTRPFGVRRRPKV